MSESEKPKKLPHYNVYTRLMPSKIHGVGVFAIRDIPKNTIIFNEEEAAKEEISVSKEAIKELDSEIKKLYEDFCVTENNRYTYCPDSFDLVTVAWYVNHSKNPNVKYGRDDNFVALRDIKKGEELTADYETYSEEPEHDWL